MIQNPESIRISFMIGDEKTEISAFHPLKKGKTLECTMADGSIRCSVYYDFGERPLVLSAGIKKGDKADLILMPHRIELWVNGNLCDEEWPAGNRLFQAEDRIDSEWNVSVEKYVYQQTHSPSVIGSFSEAEGWRPEEGIYVGDCMPYVNQGRYHVLYLKDRHHHKSKWGYGAHQWEHISTSDFKSWEIHPMAVEITESYEGSICTGSWIKREHTEYLFYTVRMADGSPAKISRSISSDDYHFEKDKAFSFSLTGKYDAPSARDPKVILGEDGMYHMILTTSLKKEKKGCLAHLVSEDLEHWQELETPIYVSPDERQPECPDYIKYRNYYYLIYSLDGKAHYQFSTLPFDGWQVPEDPLIPCSSVPKGAVWGEKIIFTGFKPMDGYAGTMTFRTAGNLENGILVFE